MMSEPLPPMEIRLGDADRQTYGGPEWQPLHAGLFVDMRASTMTAWEDQCPLRILDLLAGDFDRKAAVNLRAMAWYARMAGGVDTHSFDEFDPALLQLDLRPLVLRPEVADVDPPSSSSADTSAETPPKPRRRPGR